MAITGCDDSENISFCSDSWSFSTNWTVAAGSLSSITVEYSDFPIDSEGLDDGVKSPLLLVPPSPDCDPCEIKINFAQKQEVRQVYVRSTARIYEIYSARSLKSSNDYLCTVRCGIATRDDEVLHATDVEPAWACPKELDGEKEKYNNTEDDWVEVKALDLRLQDDRLNSVPQKIAGKPRANVQDLYEATAEFTDPDACTSLTLRMLSLQSKSCANIDEVYVFADPAEPADSETQASQFGNSATSSLMSMLVPTLLQLTKTGNSLRQDKHDPCSFGKGEYLDVGPEDNVANDSGNEAVTKPSNIQIQTQDPDMVQRSRKEYPDVESKENEATCSRNEAQKEVNQVVTRAPDFQVQDSDPQQRAKFVVQTDVPTNHIEKVLEELVSRVSRIEDICMKFEENMTKPIQSIEQRLQVVEEQVHVLAKNTQHLKLPSCTRICAPDFSCGDSNSSSFYNEGNENSACEDQVRVLEKNSLHSKIPSCTSPFAPDSSCGKLISCPCYQEGTENPSGGEVEWEKNDNSAYELPNTSDVKFLPSLVIAAPEFSSLDDEENTHVDDDAKDDPIRPVDDQAPEKTKQSLSIDDALAAAVVGFMTTTSVQPSDYAQTLTMKASEFTSEANGKDGTVTEQNEKPSAPLSPIFCSESNGTEYKTHILSVSSEGDKNELMTSFFNFVTSRPKLELPLKDDLRIADSTCGVSEENENVEEFCLNTEVGSEESILESISSPWATHILDFELPILDVKFAPVEASSATSYLDLLLDKTPEVVEVASIEQKNDDEVHDLIPSSYVTANPILLDGEGGDESHGPSCLEGEALKDSLTCDQKEIFADLL